MHHSTFHDTQQAVFNTYAGPDHTLNRKQLSFAQADLGLYQGVPVAHAAEVISHLTGEKETGFALEHLERVTVAMLHTRAAQPRKLPGAPRGFSSQRLRELFTLTAHNDSTTPARSMSGGGGGEASSRGEGGAVLDGPRFSRLLRDAGLVGRTLTRDSVDVIFAKVRAVGTTVLHFDEFCSACALVGRELDMHFETLVAALLSTNPDITSKPTPSRAGSDFGGRGSEFGSPAPSVVARDPASPRSVSSYQSRASAHSRASNRSFAPSARSARTNRSLGPASTTNRGKTVRERELAAMGPGGGVDQTSPLELNKRRVGTLPRTNRPAMSAHQASLVSSRRRQPTDAERRVFAKYDRTRSGKLTTHEIGSCFAELGLWMDMPPAYNRQSLLKAAKLKVVGASANMFTVEQLAQLVAASEILRQEAMGEVMSLEARSYLKHAELRNCFHRFAAFGLGVEPGLENTVKTMDNAHFAKMVREARLMSKRDMLFGTMDIIYTKVKPPNLRKLEYKHWLESLVLMATHNRTTMGDVVGAVLEAAAPAVNSRVEHAEEFHFAMDEKKEAAESVFYPLDPMNKGCIPHADVMHALSDLGVMDGIHSRIAGDTVAAVFTSVDPMRKGTVTLREFKQFMEKLLHLRANPFNTVKHAVGVPASFRKSAPLSAVFHEYADNPGSKHALMTMEQWLDLCLDTGLRDDVHPLHALEVCFANATPKGERLMQFDHFLQALAVLATDKNEPFEYAVSVVLGTELPVVVAARPPSPSPSPKPSSRGGHGKPPLPHNAWVQPPAVQPKVSPLPPHPIRSAQPRTPRRAQSLDPEEMLELAADAFDLYDTSGSGMLDQSELLLVLADVGALGDGDNREMAQHYARVFKELAPGNGLVSLDHFPKMHKAVHDRGSKGGGQGLITVPRQYHADRDMRAAFETFGTETKGRGKTVAAGKFVKLAVECGLVDNTRVTSPSCAFIFARARARGHRTMDYEDFLRALAMVAADKQIMFEKLAHQVLDTVNAMMGLQSREVRRSLGPVEEAIDEEAAGRTTPRYTEARKGGSSLGGLDVELGDLEAEQPSVASPVDVSKSNASNNVAFESYDADGQGTLDAEQLLFVLADTGALGGVDPKLAAVAIEHTFQELAEAGSGGRSVSLRDVNLFVYALDRVRRNQPPRPSSSSPPTPAPAPELFESARVQELFRASAAFEATDGLRMDSVAFGKLVDRCGLTSAAFSLQAADVCFAVAKAAGQRTLDLRQWVGALGEIAAERGVPVERMVADMVARKPHTPATIASTATQQRFNLATMRRRGALLVSDDEPVAIEELLLSLADVGLFDGVSCQASADSLNETLDIIMGGSGRDPVMEDFVYFHRELTRIQAEAAAPLRRLPVPAAVWQAKEQEELFLTICAQHTGDTKRMSLHVFQNTVFATGMAAMTEEAAAIAFAISRPQDETTVSFLQYMRALAFLCKSVDELVSLVAQISSQWPAASRKPQVKKSPPSHRPSPPQQAWAESPAESPAAAALAAPAPAAPRATPPPVSMGAVAAPVKAAFEMHAEGGMVGRLAMLCTLGQLGSLEKLDHRRAAQLCSDMLARADADQSGAISLEQFDQLYTQFVKAYGQPEKLGHAASVPHGVADAAWEHAGLGEAFLAACGNGAVGIGAASMSAAQWVGFCSGAKLVDAFLTPVALEVIFAKAKAMERSKTLFFNGFRQALNSIADDKNVPFDVVVEQILGGGAQQLQGARKQLGGMAGKSAPPRPISAIAATVLAEQEQKKKKGGFGFKKLFGL